MPCKKHKGAARPRPVLREFFKSAKGRVSAPPDRLGTRGIMAARPWPVLREFFKSAKGRVSVPPNRLGIRRIMAARPRAVLREFFKSEAPACARAQTGEEPLPDGRGLFEKRTFCEFLQATENKEPGSEFFKSAKGRVSAPPDRLGTRGIMAARPWPVLREFFKSAKGRVSVPPNRLGIRGIMAARPRPVLRV